MKSSNAVVKPVNWNTVNIFNDSDDGGSDENTLYMPGVDAVRALVEGNSKDIEKYCLQIVTGLIKGEILALSDSIADSDDTSDIKMMGNRVAKYTELIDNISIKVKHV